VSAKEGTNINNLLFTSAASLPIFKALNIDDVSKENIFECLLQENLDSFRYQNNANSNINTTEASGNNVNNTDNNKSNLSDVNGNNNEVNNSGLLSNQKKRRNICGC
jgi:hypothetical protein